MLKAKLSCRRWALPVPSSPAGCHSGPWQLLGELSAAPCSQHCLSEDLPSRCRALAVPRPHRAVPWGLVSLQKDGLIYGAVLEAGPGFILASEFLL